MNICVFGLWHLGTVTAACLAEAGHHVIGLDLDEAVVGKLQAGTPPLFEPGLEALVQQAISADRLGFTSQPAEALRQAEVVWVAFDTPVDDQDQADVGFVIAQVRGIFPYLMPGTLVLISSQLPVGSTAQLEREFQAAYADRNVMFAYSPENLRLGRAIQIFLHPDRVVVGIRTEEARQRIAALLAPITDQIVWMNVESAEMTKHALNAFLATSIAFMNELAVLCERVGADASEVEQGLKSETRVGPQAYLRPGGAIAGGTLMRDVMFLSQIGAREQLPDPLLGSVVASNSAHRQWPFRRAQELLGGYADKTVTVLGLTYKAGTSTLRRSSAVELCEQLAAAGAYVRAYDPQAEPLPSALANIIQRCGSVESALSGADAAIICTDWAEFKQIPAETFVSAMRRPLVLDANRFLAGALSKHPAIAYYAVGKP